MCMSFSFFVSFIITTHFLWACGSFREPQKYFSNLFVHLPSKIPRFTPAVYVTGFVRTGLNRVSAHAQAMYGHTQVKPRRGLAIDVANFRKYKKSYGSLKVRNWMCRQDPFLQAWSYV